jgi:hypothetical protein
VQIGTTIDIGAIQKLKGFEKINPIILTSCLRTVAFGLKKNIDDEARKRPNDYAPITRVLRKGRGYGPWFAKFNRYFVDAKNLTAYAGILSASRVDLGQARFKVISEEYAMSAERLARGYKFQMTRRRQKTLARLLREKVTGRAVGGELKGGRTYKTHKGKVRALARYGRMLPKLGPHGVKPRPIVEPVFRREKSRVIRDLAHLYTMKINGIRWDKGYIDVLRSTWVTPGG